MSFKLTDQNRENLNRLSNMINISGTALINYVLEQSLKELEKYFNQVPAQLKESFRQALNETKQKNEAL